MFFLEGWIIPLLRLLLKFNVFLRIFFHFTLYLTFALFYTAVSFLVIIVVWQRLIPTAHRLSWRRTAGLMLPSFLCAFELLKATISSSTTATNLFLFATFICLQSHSTSFIFFCVLSHRFRLPRPLFWQHDYFRAFLLSFRSSFCFFTLHRL